MKYWAYLLAKVAAAGAALYGIFIAIGFLPESEVNRSFREDYGQPRFAQDLSYTFAVLLFYLLCAGVLYLIVWDQKRRCRICLARLRMPVATGSWTHLLLIGPPKTEYICPFGHGTLKVPELQITGRENPDWKANEDIWTELYSLDDKK
jgi:hypothetical protein